MPSTPSRMDSDLFVTGCGVLSAVGQGKEAFLSALLAGDHAFGVMRRPGRNNGTAFLGAELPALDMPERFPRKLLRTVGLSGRAALLTLQEAWEEARLSDADPLRIGLVVGGSNVQQRELVLRHDSYQGRLDYLPPAYGLSFMDSDLCGLCSEQFGIRGLACTVGGASASGQVAVIEAARLVRSGEVDICVAVGALTDLSYWELQALRSLGAMGSDCFADDPALACRPFDERRDGFIFGEACGAVVVERGAGAAERGVQPYAKLAGWAMTLDGNRNPDPSEAGETRAIAQALARAQLTAEQIDYVNPHGTGSGAGDPVELAALRGCGLDRAAINATKSITGHGLGAAGAVEVVATLLQMKASLLHPTRNLEQPLDPEMNWVRDKAVAQEIGHALTLSVGFGGVNTALCLSATQT